MLRILQDPVSPRKKIAEKQAEQPRVSAKNGSSRWFNLILLGDLTFQNVHVFILQDIYCTCKIHIAKSKVQWIYSMVRNRSDISSGFVCGNVFVLPTSPRHPKSSKYLVRRCLVPLKAFSGDVWGFKYRSSPCVWMSRVP